MYAKPNSKLGLVQKHSEIKEKTIFLNESKERH